MTAPVSPQEIEAIRQEAIDLRRQASHEDHHSAAEPMDRSSDSIDTLLRAIAERDAIIARIQSAAKMGMDAAGAIAYANLQRAERLHAESKPEALDSERAANAVLTEECDALREALAWLIANCVHQWNGTFFRGYLQGHIEPPAHLSAILEAARSTK